MPVWLLVVHRHRDIKECEKVSMLWVWQEVVRVCQACQSLPGTRVALAPATVCASTFEKAPLATARTSLVLRAVVLPLGCAAV